MGFNYLKARATSRRQYIFKTTNYQHNYCFINFLQNSPFLQNNCYKTQYKLTVPRVSGHSARQVWSKIFY